MDKLKKQFKSISEQFEANKPFFERKIENWKTSDREVWYKQAKILFEEALACEKEIISVFDSVDGQYNRAILKVKIAAYEGLFSELLVLTRSSWLRLLNATIIVLAIVFVLRTFVFGIYHVPTNSAEPSLLVGDRVWGNKLVYFFQDPKPGDIVMFRDPSVSYEGNWFQIFWQKRIGVKLPLIGLKHGPKNMAKRVVACPGDVIEGKVEGGVPVVYRNGKRLDEPYINTFPLLALKRTVGFFEFDRIGWLPIPKFLRAYKKVVLYSYDPKKDFEEQPFYYIDYRDVLYDHQTGYMKVYKSLTPSRNKKGREIDKFGPYILPKETYWVMGDNRKNSIDSREWGFLDRKNIIGRASFIVWSLDSEEPIWFFEIIKRPFRFFSLFRWERFFKKIS